MPFRVISDCFGSMLMDKVGKPVSGSMPSTPSYTVDDATATYTVRAANEMGGLSAPSAVATITSGIETIDNTAAHAVPEAIYTLDGKRISQLHRGLNIVRHGDGHIVKVLK